MTCGTPEIARLVLLARRGCEAPEAQRYVLCEEETVHSAICGHLTHRLGCALVCMTDVLDVTRSPFTRVRCVRMSSLAPSLKNSLSGSPDDHTYTGFE